VTASADDHATVAVTDDSFADDVLNEEIATEKSGQLTVAKLDVDANPNTARDFQVVSIPTMILFKGGKPVKRIVGAKGKAALLRELSDVVG
jgi:thioredoxin 1